MLLGVALILYPTVSDRWNALHQSQLIANYTQQVGALDETQYQAMRQEAQLYNQSLLTRDNDYLLNETQSKLYETLLNPSGDGVMGYIEIPAIRCSLPVYHSTRESVLQIGVGHLDWSSLPIGGESTHCVLTGHRGLPSARLFTDLDELQTGDTFTLQILNQSLTYQIQQILVVEPHETESLLISEGEDRCTLVTCTPYGINSHRLLVQGTRLAEEEQLTEVNLTGTTETANSASPLLLALLIFLLLFRFYRDRRLCSDSRLHLQN